MNAPKEKIVFISAHPDDAEGFAATAFLLRDRYELHVIDLTHGELGLGRAGLLDGSTASTRTREETEACALLGATPHFLAEIDGDAYASGGSVGLLAAILKELRPRAVFTHWPVDAHQDHVQAAATAIHALWRLDYQPETYFFEVMLVQTSNYRPLYYVDVSSTIADKTAMLRKYACQNRDDSIVRDNLKRARIRGAEAAPPVAAAETFTTRDGCPIPGGVLEPFARLGAPPLLRRAVDGPVALPFFDEKAWAFKKGYTPLCARADECAVKGALVQELLSVMTLSGRLLAPGRDFRIDPEWGVVGLTASAPREPVRLSYAYTVRRLDSLVEKDGQTTRRYGEPHVANPVPPALADGEHRVENLLVTADGETRFPILADAADAPRTAPNAEATIPRTLAKLRSGEPVTLLAWGDSVTEAAYLPEEERWQTQFVRRLRKVFPKSEITLVTRGWGGRNVRNFLDAPAGDEHNFAETVLSVRPDLVVSEFVNDAGLPPDTAQELYGRVLADFRSNGIEWAILTPHYVRCDWMGLKGQTDCDDDPRPYTAFVRRFARENGVGLADAALRWGHLWREGIPHETLLRNAINHPNTFGMSFFADALMDFLGLQEYRHPGPLRKAEENVPCLQSQIPCLY